MEFQKKVTDLVNEKHYKIVLKAPLNLKPEFELKPGVVYEAIYKRMRYESSGCFFVPGFGEFGVIVRVGECEVINENEQEN